MCYDRKGNYVDCYSNEFCDAEPPEVSVERDADGIAVHQFESTVEAYDACQYDDNIKDGDVLVVAGEGVIGVLTGAWPVAVLYPGDDSGSFHQLEEGADIRCLGKHPGRDDLKPPWGPIPADPGKDYTKSWRKARDVGDSDANITGNDHWYRDSGPVSN